MLSAPHHEPLFLEKAVKAASIAAVSIGALTGCAGTTANADSIQVEARKRLQFALPNGSDLGAGSVPVESVLNPNCYYRGAILSILEKPKEDSPLWATVNFFQQCPDEVNLSTIIETPRPAFGFQNKVPIMSTSWQDGPFLLNTSAFTFSDVEGDSDKGPLRLPIHEMIPRSAIQYIEDSASEAKDLQIGPQCTVPEIETSIHYTPIGEISSVDVTKRGVVCPGAPLPYNVSYSCASPVFAQTSQHPLIVTGCNVEPTTKVSPSTYRPDF